MQTIDADAHVVETERTWDYMDQSDSQFRPALVGPADSGRQYWFIDGKIRGLARQVLNPKKPSEISQTFGRNVETPQAARDMEDVGARLSHMNELGIDVQVLPDNNLYRAGRRPCGGRGSVVQVL